ncbi:hydroxycarboxylic acid receptor 2-like isoform X2 [Poecilia latipinna]|uniref:hydroxycarboxylic acid receptor 2-like isoform X2 n=1 Tax=Poecilia mexicana TaxID=48701 RepID=UPI00072E3C58|nr:PREDICTED: hydroxycarboxylic acid receptor 2-like isoform X2 [Poecilia mexicana]XP_014872978.1 PREDICTED: hydroxycarboxylic acid receptor 2-like isoform X2 [Poecilia latipinna]
MLCNFSGPVLIRVLPPLLVTEFVLGLAGNGLALFIFCFHLRPWKSSTVLLFNLAVTDFMLIMALPLRASYYLSGISWMFGETICNVCLFMLAMNRSGSTFFLMAIAVDSHLRRRQLTNQTKFKKALYFIVVVVVLFIVCFLPSNITLLTMWIKMLPGFVCDDVEQLTTVFYITISLTYLNSVLDPVVYYFSSPAFKNICRRTLHLPQTETCESTEKRTRETASHSLSQL